MLEGDAHMRLGRIDDMARTFNKLLNANPDNPGLHFEIGERYRRLAERKINPYMQEAYFLKAVELLERAQALFDKTTSPPPCPSLYSLAFMYDNLGHYDKAIAAWHEIIMRIKRDYPNIKPDNHQLTWPNEMIQAITAKQVT